MWLGPVQLDQFSHIIKEPGSIHPFIPAPLTYWLFIFVLTVLCSQYGCHSSGYHSPFRKWIDRVLSVEPCFPQMPSMSDLSPHLIDSCDTRSLSVQRRLNRCPPQPEVKTKQTDKNRPWGAGEMSQWTRVWISGTQVKAWIIMQAAVTAVLLQGDRGQEKLQRVTDQLARLTQTTRNNKERESNKVKGEDWHPRLSSGPRMRMYTPNWGSCGISDNMFSWKFS